MVYGAQQARAHANIMRALFCGSAASPHTGGSCFLAVRALARGGVSRKQRVAYASCTHRRVTAGDGGVTRILTLARWRSRAYRTTPARWRAPAAGLSSYAAALSYAFPRRCAAHAASLSPGAREWICARARRCCHRRRQHIFSLPSARDNGGWDGPARARLACCALAHIARVPHLTVP